jgi:hypothetical protein
MASVICFDIDGVLTEEAKTNHRDLAGSYVYRRPRERAREAMHRAYDAGWYVVLFTGRREAHRRITEDWLFSHGFHYHHLVMDKPYFTYIIDDRILGASVDDQLACFEELLTVDESGRSVEDPGRGKCSIDPIQ